MILAALRAMLLSLARDRSALAMVFVLPPVVFIVFATAFASTSGSGLELKLAVHDAVETPASTAMLARIRDGLTLYGEPRRAGSEAAVRDLVRRGVADAGLVIRADPLVAMAAGGPPSVALVTDPNKAVSTPALVGAIERAFAAFGERPGLAKPADPLAIESVGAGASRSIISGYYAGGVAILFLLFSAVQGATTLIDERAAGTLDRVLAGPGGARHVVLGKFIFLLGQGVVQVTLVFAVAYATHGVDAWQRAWPWLATTVAAASIAASLALALAACCATRQQVLASSTFLILLMSAIGGSMAPRFTMPGWLQEMGWLTPNAWIIEAYQDALWRGQPIAALAPTWGVLLVVTVMSLVVATLGVRRLSQ